MKHGCGGVLVSCRFIDYWTDSCDVTVCVEGNG